MKKTKTLILTITVSLFLAAAQISCNRAGQEFKYSVNQSEPQTTQVNFDTIGDQDSTTQDEPFGFGVLHKTITTTWKGDQATPAYMDLGLNPLAAPAAFADMLQVFPDEYVSCINYSRNPKDFLSVKHNKTSTKKAHNSFNSLIFGFFSNNRYAKMAYFYIKA